MILALGAESWQKMKIPGLEVVYNQGIIGLVYQKCVKHQFQSPSSDGWLARC